MREQLVPYLRRHGDAVLAGAITAIIWAELLVLEAPPGAKLVQAVGALLVGLAAAHRSRAPLVFLGLFLAITVVVALYPAASQPLNGLFIFLMLAIYTAAAHTSRTGTRLAAGTIASLYVIDLLVLDPAGVTAEGVIFYALLYGAPWVTGRSVRQRRLNDTQLERERVRAAAAIADERARIARELHDVVAHSISVMVLQARGGRSVFDADPDDARAAFATIERTGQLALDEMRRLLGMLRRSDEAMALAPQPSLRQLDTLVEQVRAAGLPVHVDVEGSPRDLPPGLDLSAFRIVQEALTNALKHAGPARARVLVRYGADSLELEISDDGSGSGDGTGAGYGLVGLRERVSVYGGELQAGNRPEGGFALRVRLPLGSART